jgi:hypothetical protein
MMSTSNGLADKTDRLTVVGSMAESSVRLAWAIILLGCGSELSREHYYSNGLVILVPVCPQVVHPHGLEHR